MAPIKSMKALPIQVKGQCIATDDELFANIKKSLERGLPEILTAHESHGSPVVIVGSGPSIESQLESIREAYRVGVPVVAIKDAHDWLIEHGIIPDYAIAVDPQEHRWNCFKLKNAKVHYLIASQCNESMFEHLKDMKVTIWHLHMKKDQTYPPNRMLISGATTSGLRAISVFYVLGFRDFHLYGLDSCLDKDRLRVNGDGVKHGDTVTEIMIEPNGEKFLCTPALVLQAQSFQGHYDWMPDATFKGYGHGLVQAIIRKREENERILESADKTPRNGVSFIHYGDMDSASYRYRALIPSQYLGASIGDLTAATVVFAKPQAEEIFKMALARASGSRVIVDFCDDHFEWDYYKEALQFADLATCPTVRMAEIIKQHAPECLSIAIVPDPYEYPEETPHFKGLNLLWYGHFVNKESLFRVLPSISEYPIRIVSNFKGSIPWSKETMLEEFATADIVIIPATEDYKSPNRAVEAIRQGCFVIAEYSPALCGIPGIWIGDIKEGIEWSKQQPVSEINQRISMGQKYVTDAFGPQTLSVVWKKAIQQPTILEVDANTGMVGSMSML